MRNCCAPQGHQGYQNRNGSAVAKTDHAVTPLGNTRRTVRSGVVQKSPQCSRYTDPVHKRREILQAPVQSSVLWVICNDCHAPRTAKVQTLRSPLPPVLSRRVRPAPAAAHHHTAATCPQSLLCNRHRAISAQTSAQPDRANQTQYSCGSCTCRTSAEPWLGCTRASRKPG